MSCLGKLEWTGKSDTENDQCALKETGVVPIWACWVPGVYSEEDELCTNGSKLNVEVLCPLFQDKRTLEEL